MNKINTIEYINNKNLNASKLLESYFYNYISNINKIYDEIIFLCIGTDRITGDLLGPLVGDKLQKSLKNIDNINIYGTIEKPIHAKNIYSTIEKINIYHKNSLIIAIDASTGNKNKVGYLKIGIGSIKPGSGVNKNLPPIGDIFITGILNSNDNFSKIAIQTTRLYFVMEMVKNISKATTCAIKNLYLYNKKNL